MDGAHLILGQRYPYHVAGADGPQFYPNFDGQPLLVFFYTNPQPVEVRCVAEGSWSFALYKGGDHTLFLLFSCPGFTQEGWGEAIFASGILPPKERPMSARTPLEGRMMRMVLVNRADHVIRAMRAATMSPAFADKLDALINDQIAHVDSFNRPRHLEEIKDTYRRHPTMTTMIRDAEIVEKMGQPFHTWPK